MRIHAIRKGTQYEIRSRNAIPRVQRRCRCVRPIRRHNEHTAFRSARRACSAGSPVQAPDRAEPQSARAEAQSQAPPVFFGPRGKVLEGFFRRFCFSNLAGELRIGEALANDLPHGIAEAISVIHWLTVVRLERQPFRPSHRPYLLARAGGDPCACFEPSRRCRSHPL